MAEDNFHLNNFQVFPNNEIPSVATLYEHKQEIDDRYYDKVDRYCARNDISPRDYFEKELDKPKTPSPEKYSYDRMEMKAREGESGETREERIDDYRSGPTLYDRVENWFFERSLDRSELTEQEKDALRAKHDAERNMARAEEERLAQEARAYRGPDLPPQFNYINNFLFGKPQPDHEPRFDSDKDKRAYMFEKYSEYLDTQAPKIEEALRAKDEARGIERGPDYDYAHVSRIMAGQRFDGHEVDRGKAEARAEHYREEILRKELKDLKQQEKEREEKGKDTKDVSEKSKDIERQLEQKCTQARDIYYEREVEKYCEEHEISRNEYNSLVKEAEREGHLEHYPAEEWNTNRPYEEREQLAEARFDREVQERIQEDREREERYHGDYRFG